jgi:integrase
MPKYRRGSGSVYYKRGWCYLSYYVAGRHISEATGTREKAEARRRLHERLGQIAEGRFVGPAVERVTVDELARDLLRDYVINSRTSLRTVGSKIRLHLLPFFGGRRAHEISSGDITAYVAQRLTAQASNAEINRELAALKRMYNLGLQAEKLVRKPHFPRLEEKNARQGFFERGEFERVLARLPEELRPPITFAYYTGWRIHSEILPLSWDRVDLDAGTVRLYRGTTKNKEGRVIALPDLLGALLDEQWNAHLQECPTCPWVFQRAGARITSFRRSWVRACHEAGVLGKIPHDFRRTAVRNMVRAGVPERVAMEICGHKTRAVFDRYTIVSGHDLQEAARKIDEAARTSEPILRVAKRVALQQRNTEE